MSPHSIIMCCLLLTCKPCCLQTCNYDQSFVVSDTNTLTKFQVLILLPFRVMDVKQEEGRILPIIAPYIYNGGHGAHPYILSVLSDT